MLTGGEVLKPQFFHPPSLFGGLRRPKGHTRAEVKLVVSHYFFLCPVIFNRPDDKFAALNLVLYYIN
jgi:hypothetical protein